MNKESIVLGSGDLYCTEFMGTNAELPSNEVLETEENRLGHIKGGQKSSMHPLSTKPRTIWAKFPKLSLRKRKQHLNPAL